MRTLLGRVLAAAPLTTGTQQDRNRRFLQLRPLNSLHTNPPPIATSMTRHAYTDTSNLTSRPKPPDLTKLARINNARDLSTAMPGIMPGRLLRCAKPSDGTKEDARVLLEEVGVKDMIDLRATEELREDAWQSELFKHSAFQRYVRGWRGMVRPERLRDPDGSDVVRHQVSLLDRTRYFTALMMRVPRRTMASAAYNAFYDLEASRKLLLQEVNEGGLTLLYEILMDSAKPELLATMTIILTSAERHRPVMFFCKAGKDRTGLVAALVLTVLGATEQQIVADYIKSDDYHMVALAGIEKQPALRGLDIKAFERAPAEAMEGLLKYAKARYGSMSAYLTSIGFGTDQQQRLRAALLADGGISTA